MTLALEIGKRFITPLPSQNPEALRFNSGFNDPSAMERYDALSAQVPEIVAEFFSPEETPSVIGRVRGDLLRARSLRGVHHPGYGVLELMKRAGVMKPEDHIVELGAATGAHWRVANTRPRSLELVDKDHVMTRFAEALVKNGLLPEGTSVHQGDTSYKSEGNPAGALLVMTAQYIGEQAAHYFMGQANWGTSTDLIHTASTIRAEALDSKGRLKEGVIIPVDPNVETGFAYRVDGKGKQLRRNMEVYPVSIVHDTQIYDDGRLAVRSLPDVLHTSPMVLYTHLNGSKDGERVLLPWFPKPMVETEESIEASARVVGLMETMFRLQGFDARSNVRIASEVMKDPGSSAVVLACAGGEGTVTNGVLAGLFRRYFTEPLLNDLHQKGVLNELIGRRRLFKDVNAVLDLVNNPDGWVSLSTMQAPWFHTIATFRDEGSYNKFRDFLS